MTDHVPFCVCVPVRNEQQRLPVLLAALAAQDRPGKLPVALCINNSTDGSIAVARTEAERWRDRLEIIIDLQVFPAYRAHAGAARRAAMAVGLVRLGARFGGVLVSTDADTRPPPTWLSANLAALSAGADIVGGRLVLDDAEDAPAEGLALSRIWDAYWREVRCIEDALAPSPWDPPPRHGDHTGASLALTVQTYRSAGGVPEQPTGEDRALVIAAQAQGARLVHPMAVWTRVSPRTQGRAAEGMAEHMTRLFHQARTGDRVIAPDFSHWRRRAAWRRDLRREPETAGRLPVLESRLPPMPLDLDLRTWAGGAAHSGRRAGTAA